MSKKEIISEPVNEQMVANPKLAILAKMSAKHSIYCTLSRRQKKCIAKKK